MSEPRSALARPARRHVGGAPDEGFGVATKEARSGRDGARRSQKLGTAAVIDAELRRSPGRDLRRHGPLRLGQVDPHPHAQRPARADRGHCHDRRRRHHRHRRRRECARRAARVSMVFQHFALLPHRTVLDNAAYGLEIQGVAARRAPRTRAARRSSCVGLDGWEDKLPERALRRHAAARRPRPALAADTDILLMDEAFRALDPLIRREMQEQLVELQQRARQDDRLHHARPQRGDVPRRPIAVMRDGRIVQIGTPEEILTDPANDYVAQFVQDVDRARVLTAGERHGARARSCRRRRPRAALRVMRDLQTSAAFVVGRDRTLLGVGPRPRVAAARAQRRRRLARASSTATVQPRARPTTLLSDLFEPAVESRCRSPSSTTAAGCVGVIPRVTLLAALGNVPSDTREVAPWSEPSPIAAVTRTRTHRAALERPSRPTMPRGGDADDDDFRLPLGDVGRDRRRLRSPTTFAVVFDVIRALVPAACYDAVDLVLAEARRSGS